jgi:FkbM family methyltransferase
VTSVDRQVERRKILRTPMLTLRHALVRTGNAIQIVRTYENWPSALLNRLLYSEDPTRTVVYRLRHGPWFEMDRGPHGVKVINLVWAAKIYEPNEAFCPQSDWTVVDLGAHKGSFTVRAALSARRVIAVEPAPYNLLRLRNNLQLNHLENVTIIVGAVGAGQGQIPMWLDPRRSGLGSVVHDPTMRMDVGEVTAMTLEDVLDRAGDPVDLLKMDIEGAESDVLAAATPSVLRRVRRIILEYHDFEETNAQTVADGIVSVLSGVGFVCKIQPNLSLIYGALRGEKRTGRPSLRRDGIPRSHGRSWM